MLVQKVEKPEPKDEPMTDAEATPATEDSEKKAEAAADTSEPMDSSS